MNKINCTIENCSHNQTGVCFSNRVNIGGLGASKSDNTCCGSFLDERNYGNLTNNTNSAGNCDIVVCSVENCKHNHNTICNLNEITVDGINVKIYSETSCESFCGK